MSKAYEVEAKVEIRANEGETLIKKLGDQGFIDKGSLVQIDVYVLAHKSPHGGYDLERYRNENGKCFYTKKVWEMVDGQPARQEEEQDVSLDDFYIGISQSSSPLKIEKSRRVFEGVSRDCPIHVMIDSVQFDHSPKLRHFVEAEILVVEERNVVLARKLIIMFLKSILGKSTIVEAPGMFTMAFEKK